MQACIDNSAYFNIGFDKRVFPKIVWVPFRLQSHEPLMTYGWIPVDSLNNFALGNSNPR